MPRREAAALLWKGMWPLAPQQKPRSERRATVVITEGLIADRTFQQPVVNCSEQKGEEASNARPWHMLRWRLVLWGHTCWILLLKTVKTSKPFVLFVIFYFTSTSPWHLPEAEQRELSKRPSKTFFIPFIKIFVKSCHQWFQLCVFYLKNIFKVDIFVPNRRKLFLGWNLHSKQQEWISL